MRGTKKGTRYLGVDCVFGFVAFAFSGGRLGASLRRNALLWVASTNLLLIVLVGVDGATFFVFGLCRDFVLAVVMAVDLDSLLLVLVVGLCILKKT